jgi:multidrug efflux pump subunit AcrB
MIANWAVKNRITVLVITILLTIWGFYAYFNIPKEAAPSIKVPNIIVQTVYPGVSPDDIEALVTQPMEREIQNVTGIKELRSTSSEGASIITIQFEPSVSIEDAYQKVRDKVNTVKVKLPTDVREPVVREINLSELPILTVNLAAGYSLARLKVVADKLKEDIESVSGVLEVEMLGALEREVQIDIDLAALQSYNLSFQDVIGAIQQENANIPGGSVDVDRLNYLVRVNGEFKDPEQIKNIIIKVPEPQGNALRPAPIYVRDVASVKFGFKDRSSYSRLTILHSDENGLGEQVVSKDGKPLQVISLSIKKRAGANILETVDTIKDKIRTGNLARGTHVVLTGDASERVRDLVDELQNNLVSGIFFVIMALVFFLGIRASMLVSISIPLSMLMSFVVFQLMGVTLNFIVLFSLIIALGLLADNAIVVVENIYRYREMGYEKFEAARLATQEITSPVIFATLTTLAAFFPMLLWPGVIGKFMGFLPLTLIITLSTSLFVALVMNPVITAYLVRLDGEAKPQTPRWMRVVQAICVVSLAFIIGVTNPITLPVLAGMSVVTFLFARYILVPVSTKFMNEIFPRYLANYKIFLSGMMDRDYSVKWALLRNTFSLSAFALGVTLLILSSFMGGMGHKIPMGTTAFSIPQLVFMSVGGLSLVLGILAIFVHTFEAMIRSGFKGVKYGGYTAIFMVLIVGVAYLKTDWIMPNAMANLRNTAISLMITPVLMVILGLIGGLLKLTRPLILTDNRAVLLNITFGLFFGIFMVFAIAPTGVAFFPETDPRQVNFKIEGSIGTNINASNRMVLHAEDKLHQLITKDPKVAENISNMQVGVGTSSNPFFGGGTPQSSQITINMVDYGKRGETTKNTLTKIRETIDGIAGALLKFEAPKQGPPTGAPINIEIAGKDFSTIVNLAKDIKLKLQRATEKGQIPGLVDVRDNLNSGRPEVRVKIDRERAQQFKLNTVQIAQTIRNAINGSEASKYREGEDEYNIMVRLKPEDRANIESIKNLTIPVNVAGNPNNRRQLPISAVADLEIGTGFGSITRLDQKRVVTVQGDTSPGFTGPTVLASAQAFLKDYKVPEGYTLTYTGENKDMNESFSFLALAFWMGVAGIFLLLVLEFRNIKGPLVIMTSMILSLMGVMIGLILTRSPFGLMTFIALISLSGLVVNHAIVLIDFALKLERRGVDTREAIIEAGVIRTRPIFLTIVTSVIGLVPLVFGLNIDFVSLFEAGDPGFQWGSENGQFWMPMNVALISGSIFSIFLTLYVAPVMYNVFSSIGARLTRHHKEVEQNSPVMSLKHEVTGGDGFDMDGVGMSERTLNVGE